MLGFSLMTWFYTCVFAALTIVVYFSWTWAVYTLQGWCREKKYDLNAEKCKSICFPVGRNRYGFNMSLAMVISSVLMWLITLEYWSMTFVNHIESIVSKSAKMLGFIRRISREFNDPYKNKTLYVAFVRFRVCIVHVVASSKGLFGEDWVHSTQLYKICIARSGLDSSASAFLWEQVPLVGTGRFEWRKIAAALFVRDILCRRIESTYLADILHFESNPFPRRRNARYC
jgi:hypothetical protein